MITEELINQCGELSQGRLSAAILFALLWIVTCILLIIRIQEVKRLKRKLYK